MKQLRIRTDVDITLILIPIGEKTMGSKKKKHQSFIQKVIHTGSAMTTCSMIALCTFRQMPIVMYALPKLCFQNTAVCILIIVTNRRVIVHYKLCRPRSWAVDPHQ